MNKKGFTMVEVTLSITLILLLALLVIPSLIDYEGNSKQKLYDSKIDLALDAAYKYGMDNLDLLSNSCTDVTIGTLIRLDYISGDDKSGTMLTSPIDNTSMNNVIICVTYSDKKVKTKVK